MAKGNLTLIIKNIKDINNWGSAQGTVISSGVDEGTTLDTVFEADTLTWSIIESLWPECVELYDTYCFKIIRQGTADDVTSGNVNKNYIGIFQANAEKEPYNYSGFIYTDRGVQQAIVVDSSSNEEDVKRAIMKDMVENLFEYLKIDITIKNTSTNTATNNIVALAKDGSATFTVTTAETDITGKNAKISLAWDLKNKNDNDKATDIFNIISRQYGTPAPTIN